MHFHSIAYDFFRPEHRARVRAAELTAAATIAVRANAAGPSPASRPCRELRRFPPTPPA
jgi:hypothetical protein